MYMHTQFHDDLFELAWLLRIWIGGVDIAKGTTTISTDANGFVRYAGHVLRLFIQSYGRYNEIISPTY
jgi:hypothetical protein